MKKIYSVPVAELFEAELDGLIAISFPKDEGPGYGVEIEKPGDGDDDDYPPPPMAESKGFNPIFD